jgi:hypothetical protein
MNETTYSQFNQDFILYTYPLEQFSNNFFYDKTKIRNDHVKIDKQKKKIKIKDWSSLNQHEKDFVFFSGYDIYEVYNL